MVNFDDSHAASSMPIYQTATFLQKDAKGTGSSYDYCRSGNPTRSTVESHMAKLLKAKSAYLVSSGMSALDILTRLVPCNHEIIAGTDIYGGSNRLLAFLKSQNNITTHHVDTHSLTAIQNALNPNTRMVLLESPTNPLINIANIPEIVKLVKRMAPEALVVVDNTMMSPYLMNTLDFGADIEYHSATKYISGHHDIMAGVIGTNSPALAEKIYYLINATGVGIAPFDAFLLMRGVKTLALRMEKQQSNAIRIASYLESKGFRVRYPGLKSHPQHALHASMARGPGAVISFETGDIQKSEKVVEATSIWAISVSFGCINSLISMPCNMSHASIPAHVRRERALPEDLIRLCVGIEDVDDLIDDVEGALRVAGLLK